ncbi:uncharacterized protein AMSG_04112 [Thecamonas trahens ATCC 50062]|uniref:Uncharacterized protein n=1 Tax=Thecamonas trahens ATCC 50062 TaxID=461836 RepID=A0A0L0D668_THETB|nr:hypothetical protein AMSG_04112 [Thecamonas trahens ATCC 50062]KNC47882.1 hypothetical protein AMSG_04112 [Thecamonas trahens ATCC 50062]|eukprot:XP_013759360.1 hypothetical protein AMSG_04112 [Thecamonas trahens ATCC 50062]
MGRGEYAELHAAVREGETGQAELAKVELLDELLVGDNDGRNVLMVAAASGHPAMVAAVLATASRTAGDGGMDAVVKTLADARDHAGNDVFMWATTARPHARVVELVALLSELLPLPETLPHWAAMSGNAPLMAFLSDRSGVSAICDSLDVHGRTPLHYAALHNAADVVALVLDAGADSATRDADGCTPLHLAAAGGAAAAAAVVLASLDELAAREAVAAKDVRGALPLHLAAFGGDGAAATAGTLVAAGSPVDAKDSEGRTPLMWAAREANPALVGVLLAHAASPFATDVEANSVAFYAVVSNSLATLAPILGAALRLSTPIRCRMRSRAPMLRALLDAGASPVVQDANMRQPIHLAAATNNVSALAELLSSGAHADAADAVGSSPLHCAAFAGAGAAVAALLAATPPADVNSIDTSKHTPLHWAAHAGSGACIARLVRAGADVTSIDNDAMRAYDHALLAPMDDSTRAAVLGVLDPVTPAARRHLLLDELDRRPPSPERRPRESASKKRRRRRKSTAPAWSGLPTLRV